MPPEANPLPKRRAMLIGLDSIVAPFTESLLSEGLLPNLASLISRGAYTRTTPTLPPVTAPGWAAIASGAWPGTNGITAMSIHFEGDPLDRFVPGFHGDLYTAEPIWRTLDSLGYKSILVNYPTSWPFGLKHAIQVEGYCAPERGASLFEISPSLCFVTPDNIPEPSATESAFGQADRAADVIRFRPARDWTGLQGASGAIESQIVIEPKVSPEGYGRAMSSELEVRAGGEPKTYYLLLTASSDRGYDRLAICRSKNAADALATLRAGQWSQWVTDEFVSQGRRQRGCTQFKLLDLSPDGGKFKLYMYQVHPTAGYTVPPSLGDELFEKAGPFPEYTGQIDLYSGWVDLESLWEMYQEHSERLAAIIKYLLGSRDWDLFMCHWHPIDHAHHILDGALDPRHPEHESSEVQRYKRALIDVYRMADRFTGEVLSCADEHTVVSVTGDHGHTPVHTLLYLNTFLAQKGLLSYTWDRAAGRIVVDWSKTRAFAGPYVHVYVNTRGRDPEGIVSPGQEYRALQRELVHLLQELHDPRYGVQPVQFALTKEEARSFGLYGDRTGDVVFALRSGYEERPTLWGLKWYERDANGRDMGEFVFRPTRLFRQMTGGHGTFSPFLEELNTVTIFSGPGVKSGVTRSTPIRLIDIVPTVCHLAGLPIPRQADGCILQDLLE